ncbi:hypothetical protein F5876DRAFT_43056 [Lentinula aff. lateritia]|uniref:Uncharacterized protein n=1 Tax=Lentinula aff. lateritia TaxID=2804960 RepID=A0ACC1TYL8_9AGAR|nr:hypothetical protein F5876DRAFT_43056 [Lentinula aff. lateritia]
MLLGHEAALMSSGALGCTFENKSYSVTIERQEYCLYDTTGLDEGTVGTVVSKDALVKLYHLLHDLQGGISLLVYCMRGPRITETLERNYNIFYDGFCRKAVPIVIVVTGLEDQEPTMDSWWTENKYAFNNYGLHFVDHACITATLGKKMKNGQFRNQEEYNESKVLLRDLIVEQCQDARPWKVETKTWFVSVMKWLHRNLPSWLGDHVTPRLTDLYEVLKSFLPEQDAREIANRADMKSRNVLLFGSSGCGKSSIINMLSNGDVALTSSAAAPSIFDVKKYEVSLDGTLYSFHDITGLNNGKLNKGDLVDHDCIRELSNLVHTELQDGISLLVFCLRAPRITEIAQKNYYIFYEVLCQRKIPIVIIVTGLEDEEPDMESWWTKNKGIFASYKMWFQGHACVTTTKGKKTTTGFKKQEEYELSREIIQNLITSQALETGIQVPVVSHCFVSYNHFTE